MGDINTIISTNFNENIAYIQTNHKELFEKLSALDSAVANGHYKEKYELVYENDMFDVLEKNSGNYLYNKKLDEHTKLATEYVNSRLDNALFECFVRQEGKKSIPYITPIIETIDSYQEKNQTLKEFSKFIFFGVGLGVHLQSIDAKINAKEYLIVENDLELFRLSLFCTNYKTIAVTSNIRFAIFEDDTTFTLTSEQFLEKNYHLNHYIKYFQLMSHSEDKYNLFHLSITNQSHIRFLFHDLLTSYTRPLEYFSQGYKILQKSLKFKDKKFHNRPFLLVTSGPSLQHNIEWLKEHQEHFTIVSASSSLHFLEMHEISVAIVLHTDPFKASVRSIEKLHSPAFIEDALIFLNASVDPDFLAMFKRENVYMMEMGSNHQESAFKLTGPCVGSAGLLLLVLLEVQEVYLLGLDLAIDNQTGSDHTTTHQSTKILSTSEDAFDGQMSYKENVFEIAGNLQERVLTTPHFYNSVEIINRHYPKLKSKAQHIYNLSDGAKYTIAEPLSVQQTHLEEKRKIAIQELRSFVEENIIDSLTFQDRERLKGKLEEAESIYSAIKNYTFNPEIGIEHYIKDILLLSNLEQSNTTIDPLLQILQDFYRYILEYIYDFMLHSQDTNAKESIDKLFRKETLMLINNYKQAIYNTIKE